MYWNKDILCIKHKNLGLTLTWDVLKFFLISLRFIPCVWLTLTWDVLKSYFLFCDWLSVFD